MYPGVSSKGRVVKEMPTRRERRNSKFWRTEVVALDKDSMLIVYQVGALVVESTLAFAVDGDTGKGVPPMS